ncbi:uncharacterized protein TNCV_4978691 [Trichonephila clavipes]|nr:uncharacterized protein TNCV_4978691 [Trichonephila clavipes]
MADCEVEGPIASPRGIPQRGQCPRRGKGAAIEGTSEQDRIRWDRKGSRRISTEPCLQEEEFLGVPLTPPKRVTHFPRLEEGNVPHKYIMVWDVLGISRVLGESWTARRYPSADSRPIRKADCVSKKNPLQNTESPGLVPNIRIDVSAKYRHGLRTAESSIITIQNRKDLETRFYASQQRQNQESTDFVYDLLKLNKKLELGMSEKALVDHIFVRLEPQVQDYVEVRNPQTAIQLLEVLAKFEERYSCKATLGSKNSNNVEG